MTSLDAFNAETPRFIKFGWLAAIRRCFSNPKKILLCLKTAQKKSFFRLTRRLARTGPGGQLRVLPPGGRDEVRRHSLSYTKNK